MLFMAQRISVTRAVKRTWKTINCDGREKEEMLKEVFSHKAILIFFLPFLPLFLFRSHLSFNFRRLEYVNKTSEHF